MNGVINIPIVVIGGGAAGLCAAIQAAEQGAEVMIASLGRVGVGNATSVSGGLINAALGVANPLDDPTRHLEDSLQAGAGMCDRELIEITVREIGPHIKRLEDYGVKFSKQSGRYHQFRSPGHSLPRTLLTDPRGGLALSRPLAERARQLGIKFMTGFVAKELLLRSDGTVGGVLGYWNEEKRHAIICSSTVILATGGAGLLYEHNGIPGTCPGNGPAMAFKAGALVEDMEFVQFYPTVLAEPGVSSRIVPYSGLLNDGAVLRNAAGEDILIKHGLPSPDEVTRDMLSVVIGKEIAEGFGVNGSIIVDTGAYDVTALERVAFASSFYKWFGKRMHGGGKDATKGFLVAPMCHFYMGGVKIDKNGETGVEGLLACGEIVSGIHGANRLQGNALADCIVFGFRVGTHAVKQLNRMGFNGTTERDWLDRLKECEDGQSARLGENDNINFREVRAHLGSIMSRKIGLVRDRSGLDEAVIELSSLRNGIEGLRGRTSIEQSQAQVFPDVIDTALMIGKAALLRNESRGSHYRTDWPDISESYGRLRVRYANGSALEPSLVGSDNK